MIKIVRTFSFTVYTSNDGSKKYQFWLKDIR